ncbi:MAG: tryptophan--tRNA ligase [Candidatus Taylorbacteria bacterium]|nr:tryptophan--tRNA ligase [Candidatus Taylorbacteria bacterium]
MSSQPKTLLSGVKPTGRPHIGNYFGAMKQFVDLQAAHKDARKFFMIADYHALNFIQDGAKMHDLIIDLALDYLAIGLDPKQSVIFKQSDVSAHTELAWVFDTITTIPYLERAHAYKDAEAKNKEISVGTFNYPMLMAADILLYDANIVPVGQDQKQHIEYARDTALKFNHIFCGGEKENGGAPLFILPEPLIMKDVATVPGIDGQKMSKSYNNTIPLFATEEEMTKAVMGIVTDSGSGIPKNVYDIHRLFRTEAELAVIYEEHKGKYKALKDALLADLKAFINPLRTRREELAKDKEAVLKILKEGGERARSVAEPKMQEVRKTIGVGLY